MKNTMDDLRNHLFETIEALRDEDKPMDIDRAKAICGAAEKLIDTAKVEIQFLDITGQTKASGFLTSAKPALPHYGSSQGETTQ